MFRKNKFNRERHLLVQQAQEDLFKTLKVSLADDIKALSDDFVKGPQFFLTLRVYSETPDYLREKYNQINNVFLSTINSFYLDVNPLTRSYGPNTRHSVKLVKEASDKAISLIENENLVVYYNRKNPGQSPYEQAYQIETGRNPQVPYKHNEHKLASLPAAFANVASTSSI